jgi:hypothetical protein
MQYSVAVMIFLFFFFTNKMGSKTIDSKRPKRNKISNRLKRQRSPSPEKDEARVPAPRNPRRLKKAIAKKEKLVEEKAAAKEEEAKKKQQEEDDSMSEGEDLNKESLSKLKGAFDDDDFEGFERLDSDAESDDDQVQADEFDAEELAGSGDEPEESDEVRL